MAQNYTINSYQTDQVGLDDLQYMEDNFECLRTMFSGSSEPSIDKVAGMPWFDTTKRILKIRNTANNAWSGVMYGTPDTKIWIFENVARNGWAIDSGVTDCVLGLIGGGQDYDTTGGCVVSTWTQPSMSLSLSQIASHNHGSVGNHTHNVHHLIGSGAPASYMGGGYQPGNHRRQHSTSSSGNHTHASFGGDGSHNHEDTWRPKASVGTLQYPDV